jgi:hypothetical protein
MSATAKPQWLPDESRSQNSSADAERGSSQSSLTSIPPSMLSTRFAQARAKLAHSWVALLSIRFAAVRSLPLGASVGLARDLAHRT